MTRRAFIAAALAILVVGGILRTVWLTSDPPATNGVGIVWHDEGPWTHNARNKALWGTWVTDNWNPVYIAPVFTALEYASFRTFGVGTWQARVVPVVSGLIAVGFLMAGLAAVSGRVAGVLGGGLLAVNYVWVMWNRAALMETTMTMFIVVSWAAYALALRRPAWGWVSGAAAVLAFFTKASAAFFIGALVLDAIVTVALCARRPDGAVQPTDRDDAGARRTLIAMGVAALAIGVLFVLPHWSEFHFYNWQMSVTRKPEYTIEALKNRASWLPFVQPYFTWMWPVFAAACAGLLGTIVRWQSAHRAERLLVLWVLVGLFELVVHDSGNARRYVMFIPAVFALASIWLTATERQSAIHERPAMKWLVAGLVLGLGYVVAGSLVRVLLIEQIRANRYHDAAVVAAAMAGLAALAVVLFWRHARQALMSGGCVLPRAVVAGIVVLPVFIDGAHFAQWTAARQDLNYRASLEVGRLLPPDTLVHGKLANGLALDNRIRPVFIGRGFGNYADRLQRDDVRYILTYVSPSVGFESQAGSGLIQEILDRYPRHRTVTTFAVNETGGPDRAALIDKLPGPDGRAPD